MLSCTGLEFMALQVELNHTTLILCVLGSERGSLELLVYVT